jgi:hypothetical protein
VVRAHVLLDDVILLANLALAAVLTMLLKHVVVGDFVTAFGLIPAV